MSRAGLWSLGLALALSTVSGAAHADEERYFHHGYDYGSQSLHHPFWAILNRAYDTLQLRPKNRGFQVSTRDFENVIDNLADPFPAIRYYGDDGWGSFLKTEILPLSFGSHSARWVPNYGLHLIGGGQTFAWMREWFLDHDAPPILASALSFASLYTGALVNEAIENKGVRGYNTDAIADLYVFDLAGMVLFSFESVRKFFSRTLILSDWSLQPSITFPHGDLHNVGNYYALKAPLPFYPRLRLFVYGGVATLGGLSFKIDREYSVSVAAGARGGTFDNVGGAARVENVVTFVPSGAIFVDRNESLLASVQVSNLIDYFVSANLYPNALWHTEPGLGAWTAVGKDGAWVAGLSFSRAIGLGFGLGTR